MLLAFFQRKRQSKGHRKALFRQFDGRRHHAFPGHAAIMLKGIQQARNRSRHTGRSAAIARAVAVDVAGLIEEHIFRSRGGCRFAVVDRGEFLSGSERDQHETAAADVAGLRMRHRERKPGCYRRVHRVAARFQNINAHLRRNLFLRSHHSMLAYHGMEARVGSDEGSGGGVIRPLRKKLRRRGNERQKRDRGENRGSSLEGHVHP